MGNNESIDEDKPFKKTPITRDTCIRAWIQNAELHLCYGKGYWFHFRGENFPLALPYQLEPAQ